MRSLIHRVAALVFIAVSVTHLISLLASRTLRAPAFEAAKDEVLVLAERSTRDAAKLMLVVGRTRLVGRGLFILSSIGVEHGIAEVIEYVAMPVVAAAFDGSVDNPTAEPPIGGITLNSCTASTFGASCQFPVLIANSAPRETRSE